MKPSYLIPILLIAILSCSKKQEEKIEVFNKPIITSENSTDRFFPKEKTVEKFDTLIVDKNIKLQDILEFGVAHREKSKTVRVGGRGSKDRHEWDIADKSGRTYTRLEMERLQTLPENYTQGVSESKAFKAIGNGWTVDVIVEFFKNLK